MYKLNMELKNGIKLKLEIPAELVGALAVEHPLAVGDVNGDGHVKKYCGSPDGAVTIAEA